MVKAFSILVYSLTNHLGWIFNNKGSRSSTEATNIRFPNIKFNNNIHKAFLNLNNLYFKELYKNNSADMEIVVCEKK